MKFLISLIILVSLNSHAQKFYGMDEKTYYLKEECSLKVTKIDGNRITLRISGGVDNVSRTYRNLEVVKTSDYERQFNPNKFKVYHRIRKQVIKSVIIDKLFFPTGFWREFLLRIDEFEPERNHIKLREYEYGQYGFLHPHKTIDCKFD